MNERPYRTAAEVALELGVSLRTVRRWVADGRLRATRVGRSVRIPVDAYREASLPSAGGAGSGIEGRLPASRRAGEVAAGYAAGREAAVWPDTPERLAEQRRHAAALMDRLAARGRPASGPSDTADVILDAVREEFGAAGGVGGPGVGGPGAERAGVKGAERAGGPGAGRPAAGGPDAERAGGPGAGRPAAGGPGAGRPAARGPDAGRPGRRPAP